MLELLRLLLPAAIRMLLKLLLTLFSGQCIMIRNESSALYLRGAIHDHADHQP